jgi:hypothetical protein
MTIKNVSGLNMNRRGGYLVCNQRLRFDLSHGKSVENHIFGSPPHRPSLWRPDEIERTVLVKRSGKSQINCISLKAQSISDYTCLIILAEAAGGLCE